MKPIIIGVTKDGKVDMTIEDFRKHMNDAYNQGYNDNSLTSSLSNLYGSDTNSKWWENLQYNDCRNSNDTSTKATEG